MFRVFFRLGFQLFLTACFFLSSVCFAAPVVQGSPLPTLSIAADKGSGELLLNQKEAIVYQDWTVEHLKHKARVVMHIAGRSSAKELNGALIDAIKAAKFPEAKYQTTTLINLDDTLLGTSAFVRRQAQKTKRQFPWSSVVLDAQGYIQKQWGLSPKSSAIALLDSLGRVRFFKDGQLTEQEVQWVIQEIKQLIQ